MGQPAGEVGEAREARRVACAGRVPKLRARRVGTDSITCRGARRAHPGIGGAAASPSKAVSMREPRCRRPAWTAAPSLYACRCPPPPARSAAGASPVVVRQPAAGTRHRPLDREFRAHGQPLIARATLGRTASTLSSPASRSPLGLNDLPISLDMFSAADLRFDPVVRYAASSACAVASGLASYKGSARHGRGKRKAVAEVKTRVALGERA